MSTKKELTTVIDKLRAITPSSYLFITIFTAAVAVGALTLLGLLIRVATTRPLTVQKLDHHQAAVADPARPEVHFENARRMLNLNNPRHAFEEITIAQQLGGSLEDHRELQSDVSRQLRLEKRLQKDLEAWEKLVATRSGYRDGWYQLAILRWLVGEKGRAHDAARQALELDSNYAPARDLLELTE